MSMPETADRPVGADRVLSVLTHVAALSDEAGLDEIVRLTGDPKPTVHRALASLVRSGLVQKTGRGRYVLGDEFLRLAFTHHEARPDHVRVRPILQRLAERFGETAHYAVLDGRSIVYRAKVDPAVGAVRLSSAIGGRNPAHATAVGKLLLAHQLHDLDAVRRWIGGGALAACTPRTATSAGELHRRLEQIRSRGYAVDDQEADLGVNCLAVPLLLGSSRSPSGAISVSALAYRTPLRDLEAAVDEVTAIVAEPYDQMGASA